MSTSNKHGIAKLLTSVLLSCALSSTAVASIWMPHGLAAGLGVSTEGIGVQATTSIIPKTLDMNVGFDYMHLSHNISTNNVNYRGQINLQGEPITISWFPFHGNFNISTGVFINQNEFSVVGTPSGSYTYNGQTYTAHQTQQAGTITGKSNFHAVAPYIGIGWGDPMDGGRLTFTANAGVIYDGAPNITLTSTNPQMASQLHAEQSSVNGQLGGYQWYPVVGAGLMYRFS